jgi:hypothetical protein
MLGDFYLSNTELLATHIHGVLKLAFAGYMSERSEQPDISRGRVYRVLNDPEIRALNKPRSGKDVNRYVDWFACGDRLRWLIVSDRAGYFPPSVNVSTAYAHDYEDLTYRSFGSCLTLYVNAPSASPREFLEQ